MNQTLHIFLKDMRRFWAEIFVSVAVTAALIGICIVLHGNGNNVHDARTYVLATLATLLMVLVPVSWWILITRVIHAERLVGDTQYWITRPYVWTKLLSAKLLFLLASLYLPFFIAQCVILAVAGFAPKLYLPGLLYNLLLLTGTIILPLAAIATVTSSFARMTLTLLGIFLTFIALFALTAIYFATPDGGVTSNLGGHICLALALVVCSAAIVLQYATRKVWISRGVLIALPVLLLAATSFASKYDQAQVDRNYPITQTAAPIQLKFSPPQRSFETNSFPPSAHAKVPIKIHLEESGVAEGYAILPEAVRVQIQAPDGSHWESEWQSGFGFKFLPGEVHFSPGFWMPMEVYNKFLSMPLSVHLSLAITQAQAGKVSTVPMSLVRFPIPEFAVCGPISWNPEMEQPVGIRCDAALRDPQLTFISTRWSDGPCSATPPSPDSGILGTAWAGSLDREPAQLSISPVVDLPVNLSNSQIQNTPGGGPRFLCPGTPITFTQYSRVARMQTSVDIQDFHLPKITVQGNMLTITQ
jgi:hypothetical protein